MSVGQKEPILGYVPKNDKKRIWFVKGYMHKFKDQTKYS